MRVAAKGKAKLAKSRIFSLVSPHPPIKARRLTTRWPDHPVVVTPARTRAGLQRKRTPTMKRLLLASVVALGMSAPAHAQISLFQDSGLSGAVSKGDIAGLKSQLLKGENANQTDVHGKTVLMSAISQSNPTMVSLLLDGGASANRADKAGNTPLLLAVEAGNAEIVDILLKKGAKVDQDNREGVTPLMAAARTGRADLVERLLKGGAKVDRADFTGRTALNWAQDGRNARVTTLLRQAGAR